MSTDPNEPNNNGALGKALLDTWSKGRKSSYAARGWHAQISQLTAVAAGARAAVAAGLEVKTQRTLLAWLSQAREPSAENKRRIDLAYRILAGRVWNPLNQTRTYAIHGLIGSGDRTEIRTLTIGIGDYEEAKWDNLRREFEKFRPNPKWIEQYFIEDVIVEDIGDTTGHWEFPGASYTIG